MLSVKKKTSRSEGKALNVENKTEKDLKAPIMIIHLAITNSSLTILAPSPMNF